MLSRSLQVEAGASARNNALEWHLFLKWGMFRSACCGSRVVIGELSNVDDSNCGEPISWRPPEQPLDRQAHPCVRDEQCGEALLRRPLAMTFLAGQVSGSETMRVGIWSCRSVEEIRLACATT